MTAEAIRILLVEDNPGDARLVGALLEGNGAGSFEITQVARLDEALSKLEGERFDAVLLDLSLPDSSGVDTFEHAAGGDPEQRVPIIVLTGRHDEEEGLRIVQRGAQDFLPKNDLRAESLTRSIRHAVERQRQLIKLRSDEADRQEVRELESLEQMSAPRPTIVAAPGHRAERLKDRAADTFAALVEQYGDIIRQPAEALGFRIDRKASQGLRVLAERLGFLRAGPRDVIDLHVTALKSERSRQASATHLPAEEARLMLIELMGNLTAYYRDHMVPTGRPDAAFGGGRG